MRLRGAFGACSLGACPPGKFWISDLLRSFLVYSLGEIAKVEQLLLNLVVLFEALRIKGVTLLRGAEGFTLMHKLGQTTATKMQNT